jgi:hypothetical protein
MSDDLDDAVIEGACIQAAAALLASGGPLVQHYLQGGSDPELYADGLAVIAKEVVAVEPGDWRLAVEGGVRPMKVVDMRPAWQGVGALV